MKKLRGYAVLILMILSAGAVVLSGCGAGGRQGTDTSSITVGVANDIDSMDPNKTVSAGTRELLFNVYEGLVKPDSDGNLVPAVASAYTVNEDASIYTFTLRDGVTFHDGTPVTADDVVYSIERCADASSGNPLAPAFSSIASVEAADEKTVVITLHEGDSEFLSYLTTAVVPKNGSDYENHPIGTGPYRFVSRTPGDNIVLEKYDGYWGDGTNGGNPAQIASVTVKIVTNADTIVTNLKGGSIDLFLHLNSTQASQLGDGFTVAEGTMNLVQALYLNNAEKPFDDVRVRQALCFAMERTQIMEAVSDGGGTALGSSVYPAYRKYFMPSLADAYPTDTEKAKQLLSEAGYPDGFRFTITVPSNYRQHVDTATVLKEEFKKIGVTADIEQVEWETWLSDVYQNRSFSATVIGVDAGTLSATALLGRFESSAENNFINYSNADYDKTYAEALAETDDEAKTALFMRCEEILSEDAANVYIQDLPDFVGYSSRFTGYRFYPLYVCDLTMIRPAGDAAAQ
ncbi:ABC transporter substrate-binding protein [Lachnoclostridium sp. Marseille-P6806]|uniref:ABC transporter substrate-binding protein n=1 Tax=Lachnoclostridium sp. Marseille-P6806 TaxID=2364793 RepID=UPI00103061F8|nr:ABC transporter substrate-binding protein [Lachnoclostridium sp. Marseille-P6806]